MAKPVLNDVLEFLRKTRAAHELGQQTDGELLKRFVAQKDEASFAVLVERHGRMVLSVCQRVLGDLHLAEDSFQATFIVLARRAASLGVTGSLAPWLYAVARRIALKAKAQTRLRQDRERRFANMPRAETLDYRPWQELRCLLDEEIGLLPEKYRAALVLCYFEGQSQERAAQQLGWPKGTLARRLSRARELLRQQLTRRGITLSAGMLAAALCENVGTAALPGGLVMKTVMGATLVAAGQLLGGGHLSARALALVEEAMTTMLGIKGKLALALVAVGLGFGGVSWAAFRGLEDKQPTSGVLSRPYLAPHKAGAKLEKAPFVAADQFGDPLPDGALARLGTVRFHFTGWVTQLAFSPDGTRLACGDSMGIRLSENPSGRPVRRFDGRWDSFAFVDGGKRLATAGDNLVLWDLANGKEVGCTFLNGRLRHPTFSPDGKLLAGIDREGSLLLLDTATGKGSKQLEASQKLSHEPGKPRLSRNIAFSPAGNLLALANGSDSRVFLWDLGNGNLLRTLPGHQQPAAVEFSPDGRRLAVGDEGAIALWEVPAGRKLQELHGQTGEMQGLAFSPDGMTLASAAAGAPPGMHGGDTSATGSRVFLWDLRTTKCQPMPGLNKPAWALAFSPDGTTLAAGGLGTTIHVINAATKQAAFTPVGHDGAIARFAVSPDGSTLASGGMDGLIHLWDLKIHREKARLEGHAGPVTSLAFTADGRDLLVGSHDGSVGVWDWRSGQQTRRLTPGRHDGFALTPDGKTLLLPTGQLWNVATGTQLGRIPGFHGPRNAPMIFSSDGSKLLAARGTGAIVTDVATGKELCRFSEEVPMLRGRYRRRGSRVNCVAFSPDGRRAASGGAEGLAFVWDATTGEMLLRLEGHETPVNAIAFSPDGRLIATASGDSRHFLEHTVRVWDCATGQERRCFVGHETQVTSLVFSRDGTTIISGSDDGMALVWDVASVLQDRAFLQKDGSREWPR